MEANSRQVKNDPVALNFWWRLNMLRNTLGFTYPPMRLIDELTDVKRIEIGLESRILV